MSNLNKNPYTNAGQPVDAIHKPSYEAGFQAGAASRESEVFSLVEKCHDFAAQHETDSGIIESDGKEIHFLREQRDEWKSRTEFSFGVRDRLEQERDQLRAQINVLREAGKALLNDVGEANSMLGAVSMRHGLTLTHGKSLSEYRNKVIEAFVNEFTRHVGGDGEFWLHELQDFAMKEQP